VFVVELDDVVLFAIVVVVTAAAATLTVAPSHGAKKASVASRVKCLPLHFSASVNGVSNKVFKCFSSCSDDDCPFFLGLFQHFG